jgi:nucleoside-diphosphate-sugar epimerase
MKCVVTGGAGAIGSHLVAKLVADGHSVTVIDDLSSGHRELIPATVRLLRGSIEDEAVLAEGFAHRPDWVFHLAALFANQNSVDHPDRDLAVNGVGLVRVLERAQRARAGKVLFTSSSCVYGNKPSMAESDPELDPETPYAVSKLAGEYYCRFWSRHHNLDTVVMRLFNTYGPHEYPGPYRNVIPNFLKLAMAGKPLPITGTGEETRDFNYVGDVVDGLVAAMKAKTPSGEIYNIASGRQTRIIDLATYINAITENRAGIELKPRRGWDHTLTRCGDSSKAKAAFGFAPATTFEEGVACTYAWLKKVDG